MPAQGSSGGNKSLIPELKERITELEVLDGKLTNIIRRQQTLTREKEL